MKAAKLNPVMGDDAELFASMKDNYQSKNEREFFEKMLYKQQWECSFSRDFLLPWRDNEEGIYIIRCYFDEYIVGKYEKATNEVYVQNLVDALNLNLREIGILDEDITLFEWLRRRDYAGINYDNDHDYM